MANLNETPQWEAGVYQIETSDPVLGGPGGIANKQAEQLSNRTAWLKQQVDASGNTLSEHIAAVDPHPQYVNQSELSEELSKISFEQVNADWNATDGVEKILNKPGIMTGATELSDGISGLVPAPEAGDENKVLTGKGTYEFMSGVPIGAVEYFGMATPPPGYLKADGAAVGRETYPELFAAIGTTFGAGDGSTTFNLPDLIDRFAQGSTTPGQKIEAGLPNITGQINARYFGEYAQSLAPSDSAIQYRISGSGRASGGTGNSIDNVTFDAHLSNPRYGASDTVQPPALTLLPCIKAFDAATNPGLIDITGLAQEMADKTDGMAAAHAAMPSERAIILSELSWSNESNWFRASLIMPSDGWLVWAAHGKNTGASTDYVNGWIGMYGDVIVTQTIPVVSNGNQYLYLYIPVRKGVEVTLLRGNLIEAGGASQLKFVYAEGNRQ